MANTKKMTKREMFEQIKANYSLTNEEVAFIDHELELLAKKNSAEKKPTAVQVANEGIKQSIVDGMEVNLLFFENDLLNVQIPEKVELVIAETAPAIKGAPSNQTKDAVTNTGLKILVPQFIAEGEHVVVYTADGKYAGRA